MPLETEAKAPQDGAALRHGAPVDASPTEAATHEADLSRQQPGPPFDRRHPYLVGLMGGLGLITAYLLFRMLADIADVLLLVGVSLFLAVGFDPVITRLSRRLPRTAAAALVAAAIIGVLAAFVAAALSPIAHEVTALTHAWPRYRAQIVAGKGWLGQLAVKTHLNTYVKGNTSVPATGGGSTSTFSLSLLGGVLGAGKLVLSAISSVVVVAVLTIYFMVTLPSVRSLWLHCVPRSRRARAAAFTDEAFLRVGGYVLGNILTSVVAGLGTAAWAAAFGIPYPFLLGLLVGLLDLIPIVGSTVGGIIVSLVALTQGLPVAIATAAFYTAYRFLEDHLLNPQVMRRTVHVSAGLSIIATLIGGALLGVLGALIAVPVAATVQVILEQVTFRSLDAE